MPRRPLIAIVGDGLVGEADSRYQLALSLGEGVINQGFRLVTGGLGGVMEAASRGARGADGYQPGDIIAFLPGNEAESANPYVDIPLPTHQGHGRNFLVAQCDAIIAVGGGAGTLTELAYAWILRRLVIAMRVSGWSGKLADTRIDERVRVPDLEDDRVFGADSADEALELLKQYLPYYLRAGRRG